MSKRTFLFMSGFLFAVGLHMTIEDTLGLEGYIAFCRDQWVNLSPSVGITYAVIAAFAASRVKLEDDK